MSLELGLIFFHRPFNWGPNCVFPVILVTRDTAICSSSNRESANKHRIISGCCWGSGCGKCGGRRYISDPLHIDARRYDPDLTSPRDSYQAALDSGLVINKESFSQVALNTPYYPYAIDRLGSGKSYVAGHFIDRRFLRWLDYDSKEEEYLLLRLCWGGGVCSNTLMSS